MIARRQFLKAAGAGLAAPALTRAAGAQAPEATLKLHHFLPAVSTGHAKFLKPWADKVMAESGGRIKIDIFPSMQLGGTPPQLYDQARDGVADIVWTLPGYTPGRFVAVESIELPFVAHKRAVVNSKTVAELGATHFANDFREVKPICVWAHDHGLIHANRQVKSMDDLKGLKLRFPTRLAGEALRALGANAIGMPIPQVPEALAQKVIDGCVVPWEVVPAIKVQELVKFHSEIPGSPTLYTSVFILAMNKAKYDGLSPEAKKVIDANSGMATAEMAGKVWDAEAINVANMVKARSGNTITLLDEAEAAKWRTTTKPVVETWIRQVKEKGLDGDKILADLAAAIAKHAASA
jgi:TRAP-type C4-dicarboxylate transport system substrate-binding protein